MKKVILPLVILTSLLASCGQQEKPVALTTANTVETVASGQSISTKNGGQIKNMTGNTMTEAELLQKIPDADKALDVTVSSVIAPPITASVDDNKKLTAQDFCVFDMNHNGKCDNFYNNEVRAVLNQRYSSTKEVFRSQNFTCNNPTSTSCTVTLGTTFSYSVNSTFTGQYKSPVEVTLGTSLGFTATGTVSSSYSTTLTKYGCTTYRVIYNMENASGYYTAPFYEMGTYGAIGIGTYTINGTWNTLRPTTKTEGWYAC